MIAPGGPRVEPPSPDEPGHTTAEAVRSGPTLTAKGRAAGRAPLVRLEPMAHEEHLTVVAAFCFVPSV